MSRNFFSSKYSIFFRVMGSTKYEGNGDDTPYNPMKVSAMRSGPWPSLGKSLKGGSDARSSGPVSLVRDSSKSSACFWKESGGWMDATSEGGKAKVFNVSNRIG